MHACALTKQYLVHLDNYVLVILDLGDRPLFNHHLSRSFENDGFHPVFGKSTSAMRAIDDC